MVKSLRAFFMEENGQGLSEYGIVGAIAAVACVGAMGYIIVKIKGAFTKIGTEIDNGNGTTY